MRKLFPPAAALVLAALPVIALAVAPYPDRLPLPNGFSPEGIAIGKNNTFYVGSIPTGAIYRGDLVTGEGEVLVPAQAGRAAVGLAVDNNEQVYVSGGGTGRAWVYDGRTGVEKAALQLALGAGGTFINDVAVTRDAAWFTDSQRPVLYRVPIDPQGEIGTPAVLPLSGDYVHGAGFNLNGIDVTPDGSALIVVQSGTGKLFKVDPGTGYAALIDLGGATVTQGDGILLDGKTLYVVRNRSNLVVRVDLAPDLLSGTVVSSTGNPDFSVPTTVDEHGDRLYLVNARFGVAGATEFWVTKMEKP